MNVGIMYTVRSVVCIVEQQLNYIVICLYIYANATCLEASMRRAWIHAECLDRPRVESSHGL